jgi:hypothetical protein
MKAAHNPSVACIALTAASATICSTPSASASSFDGNWSVAAQTTQGDCGTAVRRSDGTNVGSIERVMIDKVSGKVAYAVLCFGGFMGVGVKHIPVPWDQMKYGVSLDAYEINLSHEELSRAPDEEFEWGYRDDVIGDLNFYRTPPY